MESGERIITKKGVKYRLVAPEGGWGYMICLSIAVQFIILFAPSASFGLVFNKFLQDLGEGTSGVTLILSTYTISFSVSGFMTNVLLRRMSLRQVAFLGSTIYSLGNLMSIFAQSTAHIAIANGLFVGIGTGLAFPVCYTSFNTYFTQSRLAYLSAIKVVVGLGTTSIPLLLRFFLDKFGFRGTLMMVFAIGLHSFVASAILQPVDWHLKKVEVLPNEEDTPLHMGEIDDKTLNKKINDKAMKTRKELEIKKCVEKGLNDLINSRSFEKEVNNKLLHPSTIINMKTNGQLVTQKNICLSRERLDSEDEVYLQNMLRRTSIISIGAMSTNLETLAPIVNKAGKVKIIADYFDLSLFKDAVYTNICVGISFAVFSDFEFFMLLPLALFNIGWDNNMVAKALALAAGGELAGKIALAIATKLIHFRSRYIFITGMICSAVFRSGFQLVSGNVAMLIVTTLMGSTRCLMHGTSPLVFAEHVSIERYPAAYGLHLLFFGIINVAFGPVIGLIRDVTGSYPVVFMLLVGLMIIFIVSWTIELITTRKPKHIYSENTDSNFQSNKQNSLEK